MNNSKKPASRVPQLPPGVGVLADSHRSATSNFDMFYGATAPSEVFGDGVAKMSLGPTVSKVQLFRNVDQYLESDDRGGMLVVERRMLTEVLVVPTTTLVEFCVQFLQQVKDPNTQKMVASALDSVKETFANAVEVLK